MQTLSSMSDLPRSIYLALFALALAAACALIPAPARAEQLAMSGSAYIWATGTEDYGTGYSDVLLFYYDYLGSAWALTWGSSFGEWPVAVSLTPSGDILVAGNFESMRPDVIDGYHRGEVFLLKYNQSGGRIFAKSYNWSNWNISVRDMAVAPDGSIFLACTTYQVNASYEYTGMAMLIKIDPAGNLVWGKRFANVYNEMYEAVEVSNGVVCVGGHIEQAEGATWSSLLSFYNASDGALLHAHAWTCEYGDSRVTDIAADPSGNFWATGWVSLGEFTDPFAPSVQNVNKDIYVLKASSGGNLAWAQHWGWSYPEYANDIFSEGNGDMLVAGNTVFTYMPPVGGVINGDENNDTLILEYASDGTPLQARTNPPTSAIDYKENVLGIVDGPDGYNLLVRAGALDSGFSDALGAGYVAPGSWEAANQREDENCGMSDWDLEGFTETMPASGLNEVRALRDKLKYFTGYITLGEEEPPPGT